MEFSGEDDQANSAGAPPTGIDLQQQQEWWNQTLLPDDQMQEPDWWNQTHVQVINLKSRSGLGDGPHLLIRWNIQVNPFNLPLRCRCS